MNPDHDIQLPGPLPPGLLRLALFIVFELHLAFALLTLGLTILAAIDLLAGRSSLRALRTFSTQKSLAVVIGVGVLILMLVLEPVPMLRGINRVAPGWLMLIVLLVLSLASIELSAHLHQRGLRGVLLGVGALLLLGVPAVFVSMVVSIETPEVWVSIGQSPPPWPGRLIAHYVLRLAHVLGAAFVFSAGLLLLLGHPTLCGAVRLRRWLQAGLWFQVVVGLGLLLWLPRHPDTPASIILIAAVTAAALVGKLASVSNENLVRREPRGNFAALLLLLLTGMLLVRQSLQDQVLIPLNRNLRAEARRYSAALHQAQQQIPPRQPPVIPDRSSPAVIYMESCMFCHGTVGNGHGEEAVRLAIPPEDLTAVRSGRPHLYRLLRAGVPGTAMPKFGYYTGDELDQLIDFLHELGLRDRPEPLPEPIPLTMQAAADRVFSQACAACHGPDGRGSPLDGRPLPKPPDFRRYSVAPKRAILVIRRGYPGTAMPAFPAFSEPLYQALAWKVNRFYEISSRAEQP